MRHLIIAAFAAGLFALPATAQPAKRTTGATVMQNVPANSTTVTNYYKQSVYDASDNKIGDVNDVLIGRDGRVTALVVGVGGFLGVGEKDVLVPFNAVRATTKDNKWYLVMNTTKDSLKAAPGFKYDRSKMTWAPDR